MHIVEFISNLSILLLLNLIMSTFSLSSIDTYRQNLRNTKVLSSYDFSPVNNYTRKVKYILYKEESE